MPSDDLIRRLRAIPPGYFLRIPTEELFISTQFPVGELCHEAADALLRQHFNAPEGKACSMCYELAERLKQSQKEIGYIRHRDSLWHTHESLDLSARSRESLAKYEARKQQPPETCPACNGNDRNAPCAYPGAGVKGCLRDKRLQQPPASESNAVADSREISESDMVGELKPCPFCGGEAIAMNGDRYNDNADRAYVGCESNWRDKKCPIKPILEFKRLSPEKDKERAYTAWNTRAAPEGKE